MEGKRMNQKMENLLQLGLAATEKELLDSPELGTGYHPKEKTWELIFRYAGDTRNLQEKYPRVKFRVLMNQYVLAVCSASEVNQITAEPLTEWVEKPKRLFAELVSEKRQTCVMQLRNNQEELHGKGVLTVVLDSGIDATDSDFRKKDGSSRIREIYDQTLQRTMGQEELTQALLENRKEDIIGKDFSGHGTRVAHIAAGNGGIADQSELLVVKLGTSIENSYPRTTQLMDAVDYVLQKGIALGMPVAVNISFGNNYGNHQGASLLERFIDDCSMQWKCAFCIGSGNEGLGATHAGGILSEGEEKVIELAVVQYEVSLNIQIWKEYWDDYEVELISPTGKSTGKLSRYHVPERIVLDQTKIFVLHGEPSPYSVHQEIYLEMSPGKMYLTAGIWKIKFTAGKIKSGRYDLWLPGLVTLNRGTGFLNPDSSMSCTIPATASRAITVGAYDGRTGSIAPFSGRGAVWDAESKMNRLRKPDLVAPGVAVALENGESCTGTSFATPFVTGAAALLMEWGIVQGNDPYLYGEKVKAYLIRGAKQFPGMETPNDMTGWGALCVKDSLPM